MNSRQTVKIILKTLEPKLEQQCKAQHGKIEVHPIFTQRSLFDIYRESIWFNKMKHIKHLPFIGSLLLFIKRKILKWDL